MGPSDTGIAGWRAHGCKVCMCVCVHVHAGQGRSAGGQTSFFSAKIPFPEADGFRGGCGTLFSVPPPGLRASCPGRRCSGQPAPGSSSPPPRRGGGSPCGREEECSRPAQILKTSQDNEAQGRTKRQKSSKMKKYHPLCFDDRA